MALGATARNVIGLVFRQSVGMIFMGAGLGIAAALGRGPFIGAPGCQSAIYGSVDFRRYDFDPDCCRPPSEFSASPPSQPPRFYEGSAPGITLDCLGLG